jgi:predicted  nucleic acid-binding Zn-ribbon protein
MSWMARFNPFRNRIDALSRRKGCYACAVCGTRSLESDGRGKRIKTASCLTCGSKDFHYFPSRIEADRFTELILMRTAGVIGALEVHPRYDITVNAHHIMTVSADFSYNDLEHGGFVVEDVKAQRAPMTREATIGHKLVKACHGVDILIVRR